MNHRCIRARKGVALALLFSITARAEGQRISRDSLSAADGRIAPWVPSVKHMETSDILTRAAIGGVAGGLVGLYVSVQTTCHGFTVDEVCRTRPIAITSAAGTLLGSTVAGAWTASSRQCSRAHRLALSALGSLTGFAAGAGVMAIAGRQAPTALPVLLLLEPLGTAIALRRCVDPPSGSGSSAELAPMRAP
ncbi:MAG: hypothetical protein NVS4B3_13460 [Gemmatimonadaceae bacterium]